MMNPDISPTKVNADDVFLTGWKVGARSVAGETANYVMAYLQNCVENPEARESDYMRVWNAGRIAAIVASGVLVYGREGR